MSHVQVTATEVFESLNGYEEIGIVEAFGAPPAELKGSMLGRALVFVVARRDGTSHAEAVDHAMKVSLNDLTDYFVPEDDDAAGKEQALPEPQPEN